MEVSPIKTKKKSASKPGAPTARYAKKKSDEEVDSVKENLGKALGIALKSKVVAPKKKPALRFSDDTKAAAVTPLKVRRSRESLAR